MLMQMTIFKYLDFGDQDLFQNLYRKMLANRLVSGLPLNMERESAMISNLKKECGCAFTTNLERMHQVI